MTKKTAKILIIVALIFLVVLFIIGIVQSFIIQDLQYKQQLIETEYVKVQKDADFVKNNEDFKKAWKQQKIISGGEYNE